MGKLTQREKEVLQRIARGLTVNEVAGVLNIHPSTVATHGRNLRIKLGARNCAHAVSLAIKHKIISI